MSAHAAAGRHYDNHPGIAPFADDPRRACKDMDTDLFFPEDWDTSLAAARAACRRCPLRNECKEWAVTAPELHGYWGNTSATWRKAERQRRARAARQTRDGESAVAA